MKKQLSLKELNELDLHDQSLENIFLDFANNRIVMKLGVFNEQIEDYDYFVLDFTGVKQLTISDILITSFYTVEIFSQDVWLTDENIYYIKFVLKQDSLEFPNAIMQFAYDVCYVDATAVCSANSNQIN